MSELLSKSDILKRNDYEERTIHIPEWGGNVLVRSLTARQQGVIQKLLMERQFEEVKARTAAYAVIDPETGKRMFQDYKELMDRGGKPMTRIFDVVSDMSGIGEDEDTTVEDLKENSGATTVHDSDSSL